MTEQPLKFLSLKEAAQAHLSLRTLVNMLHSQAKVVGNHMSWLKRILRNSSLNMSSALSWKFKRLILI